ncbi:hypothetical protein U879_09370 [Defluviimonas sp. 20V17]|uniref:Flagellar motility protein MotE, a chaperone for MotC folding n=1 Tax=Allgaiera indica TaxID=765699 RepID=A0AAN4UPQ2_9RHOB|nr:hypothetical protein [Allgaiera indica]KDB03970.1 hypothetical protein U879_09370 [Defluviimonas sp. 20V17]GHD99284.1 hypothetical protein GCM10008024_06050 [Allgaiera indica]SDW29739.1 Flagellar motility protein MotE, a chaperone for MotC folding [Allgaiera indica]
MVTVTPFKLMIGLLAVAGAAKAATSLPIARQDTAPARLILAAASAPASAPAPAAAAAKAGGQPAKAEAVVPAATAVAPSAPAKCQTPEEILQSFQQERALIDRQKAALAAREAKLSLARQGVDTETQRLKALKAEVAGLLKKATAAHDADLERLVKLYQTMKPQDAAAILNSSDLEVTVMVLSTMNERKAAPIMAQMAPDRVRAVSKIILERAKLPGDQNVVRVKLND